LKPSRDAVVVLGSAAARVALSMKALSNEIASPCGNKVVSSFMHATILMAASAKTKSFFIKV
jgi:hypothetical protein